MLSRREVLQSCVTTSIWLAGCTQRNSQPPTPTPAHQPSVESPSPIELHTVTDQPIMPLAFRIPSNNAQYIADRPGIIYLQERGELTEALDISDRVRTGSERGLLGLALHPNFAENNLVYIRYSAPNQPGTPDNYSHTFRLSEFSAHDDGSIDDDSERVLLEIPQPKGNHNSGPIEFGPEGYLYIGVGDGGGADDQGRGHVEDWYDAVPGGNGQNITENMHGSLLRIDVDNHTDDKEYGIPDDNPLVGSDGFNEIYAWGLRNPWGHSFYDDTLYLADVGQNRYEEVNIIKNGGNYGWNVKEATHCFNTDDCPEETPDGHPLIDPIIEYSRFDDPPVTGIAVVGGHIYRGTDFPALDGQYVFGDLQANGRLFTATPSEKKLWDTDGLPVTENSQSDLQQLFAIEQTPENELVVLTSTGVHRVVPAN